MDELAQDNSKKIFYTVLVFSFLVHLGVSLMQFPSWKVSSPREEEEQIVIRLMPQPLEKKDSKQIVRTEKSKIKKSKNAKFLSKNDNFFARETRNARTGVFQAAAKGVEKAHNHKIQRKKIEKKKKKVKKINMSDLAIKPMAMPKKVADKKAVAKRDLMKKGLENGQKKGIGLGQTNDYLEKLPLGDFTKLNTQEYEFYGFYNRIREKLEQFWGVNIQEQADKLYKQGRTLASDSNLITGLTIQLNGKGEIVEIQIKSTSGMKEMDDAAIEAFNQAGPFPNPPKGMVRNDRAVIEWGFVVNT